MEGALKFITFKKAAALQLNLVSRGTRKLPKTFIFFKGETIKIFDF